ncbi:hypothetical protein [Deinococcus soli (ex Cha et al. 2016)]|uniref:Uncharacterized protein n=2 Tax=Deinococcus soli (ex Cha et al. 2016) TaxID=1309411 RepID=A0AAE3XH24_9DEIO|nr:hypothetical protein [Deinococcus soli (ex Cha et al. 2016)]MDR6221292.1 hypothetical protein [Deinococcus soli (ex Cha et al. 2016)]MDR6331217.1 hypothetical protein [Deinococcus soli (ex Cha et al. 2016)]MDR6754434.1 hypothetical protein [Deinococcus soli (ex Cha et al. 2016)]
MNFNIAHVNIQGQNCLICEANAQDGTDRSRSAVLARLVAAARAKNLRVDKSALAYTEYGRLKFYGTPDLVKFLANNGLPNWTHTLTL